MRTGIAPLLLTAVTTLAVSACGSGSTGDSASTIRDCRPLTAHAIVDRLRADGLQFSALPVTNASQGEVTEIVTLRSQDAAVTGFLDIGVFKTCSGADLRASTLQPKAGAHVVHYANVAGIYAAQTPSGAATPDHLADVVRAIHP